MKQSIKSKVEAAPLFLQKTYTMFENAPPRVAAWANKGTTVVIKEPEEFAKKILPQYFKHSNFSSFVRQLNFYGFRKYKKDDILIHEHDDTKHWWEFRHEKFVRNLPELMGQIRRKTYADGDAADHSEVDTLKTQVQALQSQFDKLTDQIKSLTHVVTELVESKKRVCPDESEDETMEKRFKVEDFKLEDLPIATPVLSKQNSLMMMDQLDDVLPALDDSPLDNLAWLDGLDFKVEPPQVQVPVVQRCTNRNSGPLSFFIAMKPQKAL